MQALKFLLVLRLHLGICFHLALQLRSSLAHVLLVLLMQALQLLRMLGPQLGISLQLALHLLPDLAHALLVINQSINQSIN